MMLYLLEICYTFVMFCTKVVKEFLFFMCVCVSSGVKMPAQDHCSGCQQVKYFLLLSILCKTCLSAHFLVESTNLGTFHLRKPSSIYQ